MSTTPQLDAWRTIANREGPARISIDRADLRTLITEIDSLLTDTEAKLHLWEGRTATAVVDIGRRAAIAEADADRLAEALEVTAQQADAFQQGNVDRLLAAHREAVNTRPA